MATMESAELPKCESSPGICSKVRYVTFILVSDEFETKKGEEATGTRRGKIGG